MRIDPLAGQVITERIVPSILEAWRAGSTVVIDVVRDMPPMGDLLQVAMMKGPARMHEVSALLMDIIDHPQPRRKTRAHADRQ